MDIVLRGCIGYLLPLMYPRKRGYRFPFLNKRSDLRVKRHSMFVRRPIPNNLSRDTYIKYNARVRKHNRKVLI